jgi:hypothetical protein
MGDRDEGHVLNVRPEIQFAKDAAFIARGADDLAVRRDGGAEVLPLQ